MEFAHVRIDDRLIHAQVTLGWVRKVEPSRIVVVNDQAAHDPLRRSVLEMVPVPGVQLSVLSVDEFQKALEDRRFGGERIFLIFGSPVDVMVLFEHGFTVSNINVGNIGYQAGRRKITKEVHANDEELAALKELARRGVMITAQALPNSGRVDLNRELAKYG